MPYNSDAARRVVDAARAWIGTPYRHQASLRGAGCDCLGLVRGVWRAVEGQEPEAMPAYSSQWAETGCREGLLEAGHRHFVPVAMDERMPGDVLVFRLRSNSIAKHCGLLTQHDRFVHAYDRNAVVETALPGFWANRIAGVFRFPCVADGGDG